MKLLLWPRCGPAVRLGAS